MDLKALGRNEYVAMAGGLLLAISVFLPWFATAGDNKFSTIDGDRGTFSCWEVFPIMRWLLLLAALAPFILAYIIARGHKLSWARGEMTAVVALSAFVLVLYNGVVDRPGDNGGISLKYGWLVALLATLLMFFGSAIRASDVERKRKPPGTI